MKKTSIFMFFLLLFISKVVESKQTADDPAVSIEVIRKVSKCLKSVEPNDVAIFDIEVFYKSNEQLISGRLKKEKRPYTIRLGKNQEIKAIEDAVIGMCPGEYRKITVPPSKAYGEEEHKLPDGRTIPSHSTIISHMTLIQVLRQTSEEQEQAFKIWDTDEDGLIDKEELSLIVDVYSKVTGKESDSEMDDVLNKWFSSIDANSDGYITKDEFSSPGKKFPMDNKTAKLSSTIFKQYMSQLQPSLNEEEKRIIDEL